MRGGEVFVRRTPWTGPVDGSDGARASGRCTCTAWAARRRTGPTWPPCSPCASTAGRSTCPASAARSRRRAAAVLDPRARARRRRRPGAHPRPARATAPGRPVHLLGNSLGGLVSVLVAARRPDLVASLTLDLPGHAGLPGADGVQPRAAPAAGARASRRWPPGGWPGSRPRRASGRMVRMCFGDPSRVPPERLEQAVQEMRERAEQPWADRGAGPQHARAASPPTCGSARPTPGGRPARLTRADAGDLGRPGPAGRSRARPAAGGRRPRCPAAGARGRRARGDARGARGHRARGARAWSRSDRPTSSRRRAVDVTCLADVPEPRCLSTPRSVRLWRADAVHGRGAGVRPVGRTPGRRPVRRVRSATGASARARGPLVRAARRPSRPRRRSAGARTPGSRSRSGSPVAGCRRFVLPVRLARLRLPAADHRDGRRPARPRLRRRRRRLRRGAARGRDAPSVLRPGGRASAAAAARGRRRRRRAPPPPRRAAGDLRREGRGHASSVVDGTSPVYGTGPLKRFIVEVEDGIDVDGAALRRRRSRRPSATPARGATAAGCPSSGSAPPRPPPASSTSR